MKFWTWLTNLFADKTDIVVVIDNIKVYVDKILPIVEAIDKEIKPHLQKSDNVKYTLITTFLLKYTGNFSEVAILADKLIKLSNTDLLFNLALEILKLLSAKNTSLSVLRLAVELAYNLYKASKKV